MKSIVALAPCEGMERLQLHYALSQKEPEELLSGRIHNPRCYRVMHSNWKGRSRYDKAERLLVIRIKREKRGCRGDGYMRQEQ